MAVIVTEVLIAKIRLILIIVQMVSIDLANVLTAVFAQIDVKMVVIAMEPVIAQPTV